ncbi:MAG: hypothetical protein GXO14_03220 [Thermococci archaeon]|nr:hypothetical protein [Thermococci archaeon]
MKNMIKGSLSDYLLVEILAVILAAVLIGSVTAYISANSIYRASIIGGMVTPILGTPGYLSGQISEKPPSYYAEQYVSLRERISDLFGRLVWLRSTLISAVYAVAVIIALFPFIYRQRVSFVPLLFRERSGPVVLALKGLLLSLFFLIPLFVSSLLPLLIVSRNWLSGIRMTYILLLSSMLISLLLMLIVAVYSTYILWGRIDLALIFTLLIAFGLSGKLGFEWRTVWVYLGISASLVAFMSVSFHRRWMII